MSKVFGIGWAKTGTTTLGRCFKVLGFNHQSQDLRLVRGIQVGDLTRVMAVAGRKETFEDWPWVILYEELDRAFPGSQFVLTKRDPEKWIRSYTNILAKQGEASEKMNGIRRTLYGLPFPQVTEAQLVERYEAHNRDVEGYFRERPKDLLVVDWERGDGWAALCDFLGCELPRAPFPHANRGRYSGGGNVKRAVTVAMRKVLR